MSYFLALATLVIMMAASYAVAHFMARGGPKTSGHGRLGCLDGLRGYLALSVVAHHFLRMWNEGRSGSLTAPDGNVVYQNLGPTAVMLFFMITALLFYGKILSAQGRLDWFALYTSRLFRLTPAYYVVLALMLVLLMTLQGWKLMVTPVQFITEVGHWAAFTLPGSADVNGYPHTTNLLAGVIWTLRYEWLFYICLPLLALTVRALRDRPHFRVGLLLAAACATASGPHIEVLHFSSEFAAPFLFGMIVAEMNGRDRIQAFAASSTATWVGLACLATLLICPPELALIWRAPFLIVFFGTVVFGNDYFGLLRHKESITLGDASYSIYLLHGLTLNTLAIAVGSSVYASHNGIAGWVFLPPIAILIVVLSTFNYRFVEAPFIDFGRSLLQARHERPVLAKVAP